MITVALPTFKEHPDDYLKQVEAGEDLLIRPTIAGVSSARAGKRPFGLDAGKFVVPDDYNDPLPEDLLRLFEGEEE